MAHAAAWMQACGWRSNLANAEAMSGTFSSSASGPTWVAGPPSASGAIASTSTVRAAWPGAPPREPGRPQ